MQPTFVHESWKVACLQEANRRSVFYSDILHPSQPNISKDDLRAKLSELYKTGKDQVSTFGLRTHYGGGKSTGFALIYDSTEAMKKFEPAYRLVRIGAIQKIDKPSRQQRTFSILIIDPV